MVGAQIPMTVSAVEEQGVYGTTAEHEEEGQKKEGNPEEPGEEKQEEVNQEEKKQEEELQETAGCTCEETCTEESRNTECPVCGAEGASLEACAKHTTVEEPQQGEGEPEETTGCTCEEACTEESRNTECPVCGAEGASLETCAKHMMVEEPQQGEGEPEETTECICEEACTEESRNKECPVCGAEGASIEACAKYDTVQKKWSVQEVQALIDALPEAKEITAENGEEVQAQMEEIEEAMAELTLEEQEQLDLTRYDAAVKALKAVAKQSRRMLRSVANGRGEAEFLAALNRGDATITLTANTTVTSPLTISRSVDIDTDQYKLTFAEGLTVTDGTVTINPMFWSGRGIDAKSVTVTGGRLQVYARIPEDDDNNISYAIKTGSVTVSGGALLVRNNARTTNKYYGIYSDGDLQITQSGEGDFCVYADDYNATEKNAVKAQGTLTVTADPGTEIVGEVGTGYPCWDNVDVDELKKAQIINIYPKNGSVLDMPGNSEAFYRSREGNVNFGPKVKPDADGVFRPRPGTVGIRVQIRSAKELVKAALNGHTLSYGIWVGNGGELTVDISGINEITGAHRWNGESYEYQIVLEEIRGGNEFSDNSSLTFTGDGALYLRGKEKLIGKQNSGSSPATLIMQGGRLINECTGSNNVVIVKKLRVENGTLNGFESTGITGDIVVTGGSADFAAGATVKDASGKSLSRIVYDFGTERGGQKVTDMIFSKNTNYGTEQIYTDKAGRIYLWLSKNDDIRLTSARVGGALHTLDENGGINVETHTVTFDSQGGSAVADQTVADAGKVTRPADPVKAGYVLEGWYHGDIKWNFETDIVTGDLTLTANWVVPQPAAPSQKTDAGTDNNNTGTDNSNSGTDNNNTGTETGNGTGNASGNDSSGAAGSTVRHVHLLIPVAGKEATGTADGNKAYYRCSGCGKWFEDGEGTKEITDKNDILLPATGQQHTRNNAQKGNPLTVTELATTPDEREESQPQQFPEETTAPEETADMPETEPAGEEPEETQQPEKLQEEKQKKPFWLIPTIALPAAGGLTLLLRRRKK